MTSGIIDDNHMTSVIIDDNNMTSHHLLLYWG
jgi:hypothetical protein